MKNKDAHYVIIHLACLNKVCLNPGTAYVGVKMSRNADEDRDKNNNSETVNAISNPTVTNNTKKKKKKKKKAPND